MLGVRCAIGCRPPAPVRRSPWPHFCLPRVDAANCAAGFASHRSRYLGTAFHSPVTTLAHHYEVSVPGLYLRHHTSKLCETVRSPAPPLRFGFEADAGRRHRRTPVFHNASPRSGCFDGLHSPSGRLPKHAALRIKAFNRFNRPRPALPNARCPYRPASSRSANRSVNLGTESIMTETGAFVNCKPLLFRWLSSAFWRITFQQLSA